MNYRREIDGLRAIAVLPVILFHAGFEGFSGGFVGVDVFFVISGYLITTIILADLEQGRFSITEFYERRARRILPVLFLIMIACIPFAWLLLSPSELIQFSKSLIAVPLFVSNIFFWKDGGYFETAAELKPLLHTWSLAVEEQFYILFPPLLLLFWRFGKRVLITILGVIFIVSLTIAQWGGYAAPTAAFFLLPSRSWELLIGAFAAFYILKPNRVIYGKAISDAYGWLGLALILYSIFYYDKSTPFPGFYALVPTFGAVLVIVFATKGTTIASFIGNKLFVGIGLVSYSAYLWHQPVLAYARHWNPHLDLITRAALIGLVFLLSLLSWRYVENPFRSKTVVSRKFIFSGAILTGCFFVLIGLSFSKIDFKNEESMARALVDSKAIYSQNIDDRRFAKYRIEHETMNPEIIILGSSRMMQVGDHMLDKKSLNLSVSGASVEDVAAIWQISSAKFSPAIIYIGVDPWFFNINSGQKRWISLSSEYSAALYDLDIKKTITIQKPIAPSFYNDAMVQLYDSVNQSRISATDDSPSFSDKIRKDGSRVYNSSFTNKTSTEVEREASKFLYYSMSDFKFSDEAKIVFEKLVTSIKPDYEVVLVLPPYHPTLFELSKSGDQNLVKMESMLRDLAHRLEIPIVGSYDPVKARCSADEFFDGMHPKGSCMTKVLHQEN